jgi:RHS repeat-associated protein
VTALVNAATGAESARYEYGPFAEPIRMTGVMARVNPIRFSTQYADDVIGDVKYLFRDYDADMGRWPSRDPISEMAELSLYVFIRNDGLNGHDNFGLFGGVPYCIPGYNCPPYHPPIPPPPSIDCSGYGRLYPASCTDCAGKSKIDWYPGKARSVCEGFANQYTGSLMQREAACVATCLIAAEAKCQAASKDCDTRNCCRLEAHVKCYASCLFLPHLGLPPGGASVGWNDLLPSAAIKCAPFRNGAPIFGP